MKKRKLKLFTGKILKKALSDSFLKLNPKTQLKNPVMFLVYIGALFTTYVVVRNVVSNSFSFFNLQICIWLWFTLLFANFAEAIAEGQGRAVADSLKKTRSETVAKKVTPDGMENINSTHLKTGDIVECVAGDVIPCDGDIIEGIASIDESAITGESAPVIRESGGDRSAVTMGTRVLSDRIVVRVSSEQGKTFLDKMIALIEGAVRQKTPNEIALTILLSALSIIFLIAVSTLVGFLNYSVHADPNKNSVTITMPILISLLVCLIPTTIGGLLSAIGISGMDRLLQKNVLANSGKAVEVSGDIDVLLLDKTGTITYGNRMAAQLLAAPGIEPSRLALAAYRASLADETPEGKSIVKFIEKEFDIRQVEGKDFSGTFVPFTALTRMSGIDMRVDGKPVSLRKGSSEAIRSMVTELGGHFPDMVKTDVYVISLKGGTPLVVAENSVVLGVIHLKDIVKKGIRERFAELRKMGIKTVMITGDNQLTASVIAAEAGVDDFIAEANPEMKLKRIREEQAAGHLVGMVGDGTNDAPAMAQADIGLAMNSGTQTAKEAGNMVDLDSNPTKLIEVVETGKQLLMTRGALTTFSIANDIAKYFAILPAIFMSLYAVGGGKGPLSALNVMHLATPESAILSAVIFNALIIVALIPLALKGVKYKPIGANRILRNNLWIYGFGGIVIPFIGIKLIDIFVNWAHLV